MAFAALDLVPVFKWGYETILRHLLLARKSLLSYHHTCDRSDKSDQ